MSDYYSDDQRALSLTSSESDDDLQVGEEPAEEFHLTLEPRFIFRYRSDRATRLRSKYLGAFCGDL